MTRIQKVDSFGSFARYLVLVDGTQVGMLEKGADSKYAKQPWKAFDASNKMVGAFWKEQGGKEAAISAVLSVR